MTIPEAAQLVIQAGSLSTGDDIFVLDMGEPIGILNLAQNMARLSGLNPKLDPKEAEISTDILIKEIGLRHGEKLHEELSYSKSLKTTEHPRILKSDEILPLTIEFQTQLSVLIKAIRSRNYKKMIEQMTLLGCDTTKVLATKDPLMAENDDRR